MLVSFKNAGTMCRLLPVTLALLGGCASPPGAQLGGRVALQIPVSQQSPSNEWRGCGPRALHSIGRYWGVDLSQCQGTQHEGGKEGTLHTLGELRTWAEQQALASELSHGSPKDLSDLLQAGIPVIIVHNVNPYPNLPHPLLHEKFQGHALVVVGFDDEARQMRCYYTDAEEVGMPYEVFFKRWREADYAMLTIWPADAKPSQEPGTPGE